MGKRRSSKIDSCANLTCAHGRMPPGMAAIAGSRPGGEEVGGRVEEESRAAGKPGSGERGAMFFRKDGSDNWMVRFFYLAMGPS